jgi:enoyl-CoA hydratase/carnithine racemase
VDAREAARVGIAREVAERDVVERALELAGQIAGLPREAVLHTKRRALLARDRLWRFLFEEERRAFARALLGPAEAGVKPQGEVPGE